MATPQEIDRANKIAETKRELQRRASDLLAIYNPLKEDLICVYDGYSHVAPAGQESTHPRYVAKKMMKEFADMMINTDEQTAVDKENAKRKSKGWQPLNPEEKNDFVSGNSLMTSNKDLREQYMGMIYKGVSKEYGLDIPQILPKKKDVRPEDDRILERLDKKLGTVLPEYDMEKVEVEEKKEELLKELDE